MQSLLIILSFFFVTFTDKGDSKHIALSHEALELRDQRGIAIDSLDYAVCPAYLEGLREAGARVCYASRWMNGATIEATHEAVEVIEGLPYVASIEKTHQPITEMREPIRKFVMENRAAQAVDWHKQIELFNLHRLHELGYKGQGITIAVVDVGFRNLNTLTVFDSIRNNGQLLGTYDFADEVTEFYGEGSEHGSMCLGLIAANREDYQGAANQAKFYAIRSEEVSTESPKEADNWIAAVELSDSLGVWIISTSLGYSVFDLTKWNYEYESLDGKTYRASRAAEIAAAKGLLLCTAAGNSRATDWPWVNVPGDSDGCLTIGAVDKDSVVTSFSSKGLLPENRVKPDLCAQGKGCCIVNTGSDQLQSGNGTSFATPLTAGLAACLWSAFPQESNMQIRERIVRSAHKYLNADGDYGYGIPDAWKAYKQTLSTPIVPTTQENVRKILRNGHVVIERNGVEYSILGQEL